jgi:hypothetical protein
VANNTTVSRSNRPVEDPLGHESPGDPVLPVEHLGIVPVTIEPSIALQRRDLVAFLQPSFPTCFKIQEAWQMWAIAQQLGPTKHVSMAFGPMHRVAEKPAKGVTAIGYTVSFTLKSPKRNVSALLAWVILGAGTTEEVLKVTSTSHTPMPAAAVTMALGHLEDRLIAYAAS